MNVRIRGDSKRGGLENGVRSFSEYDRECANAYSDKTDFKIRRKYGVNDLGHLFEYWKNFGSGYGHKQSTAQYAKDQGGKDPAVLVYHFYKCDKGE